MRPIPAEKSDPKVQARNVMMGITEKKDNGRVSLVMSLVSLARAIDELEVPSERDWLAGRFFKVMKELNLTDRESRLYEYESKGFGV